MSERARERRERTDDPSPTTPPPEPVRRPRRPVGVELAAAIMVVGGLISTLTSIEAAAAFGARGELSVPLTALSIGLGVAFVILGLLLRTGRAWLVALNVAAVAGFLELTSGTAPGLLFGVLDVLVVLLLLRDRPWFRWSPDAETGRRPAGQPLTPPTASPPTR